MRAPELLIVECLHQLAVFIHDGIHITIRIVEEEDCVRSLPIMLRAAYHLIQPTGVAHLQDIVYLLCDEALPVFNCQRIHSLAVPPDNRIHGGCSPATVISFHRSQWPARTTISEHDE